MSVLRTTGFAALDCRELPTSSYVEASEEELTDSLRAVELGTSIAHRTIDL